MINTEIDYGLCRRKEKKPEQITILISAHKDSDILHRSISLGVEGYIFKPLDINQTINLLQKVVNNINMQHENIRYKKHLEKLVDVKTKELIEIFTTDNVTNLFSLAKLQQDIKNNSYNSLALLKIRHFKHLNDFYGYKIGNEILKQTASILQNLLDTLTEYENFELYRVTGGDFAILTNTSSAKLEQMVTIIVKKYELTELNIQDDFLLLEMDAAILDNSCEISLSHADKALRQSEKEKRIILYKHDLEIENANKLKLQCKNTIKKAILENRFIPYYQAIIDNETLKIHKYEALVRMIDENGNIISPAIFLDISKETKMYHNITKIMVKTALNDFKYSSCNISINLAIDDINSTSTREFISQQISNFPDPSRIIFEILETDEIDCYVDLQNFIYEIKNYGCKIAIDDFGSGYSNFENLTKLDIDFIKIDGSLIQNIDTNYASRTIVEMLSTFAKKIGVRTIAEFVSDENISLLVNSIGINESQGYLFSKPIPFDVSMNNISHYSVLN